MLGKNECENHWFYYVSWQLAQTEMETQNQVLCNNLYKEFTILGINFSRETTIDIKVKLHQAEVRKGITC